MEALYVRERDSLTMKFVQPDRYYHNRINFPMHIPPMSRKAIRVPRHIMSITVDLNIASRAIRLARAHAPPI